MQSRSSRFSALAIAWQIQHPIVQAVLRNRETAEHMGVVDGNSVQVLVVSSRPNKYRLRVHPYLLKVWNLASATRNCRDSWMAVAPDHISNLCNEGESTSHWRTMFSAASADVRHHVSSQIKAIVRTCVQFLNHSLHRTAPLQGPNNPAIGSPTGI
jgi:hypothetical protein